MRLSWARLSLIGGTFAAVTLAATWLSLGARYFWLRLAVFCFTLPAARIPLADTHLPFEISPSEIGWWSSVLAVIGGLLMAAWLTLARHLRNARRRSYFVVAVFTILSLMLFAAPTVAYLRLLNPVAIPSEPLPKPNAYDKLFRLDELVEDPMISNVENATPAALHAFVNKHDADLEAAHDALKRPCRVPVDYFSLELNEFGPFHELARAILAQAKLAQIKGRTDEPWRAYQDTIRLGGALSDGGVLVDYLVGVTIEGIGVDGMGQAIDSLATNSTAEQCHEILTYLQTVEIREVPVADILRREKAWSGHAQGWLARLYSALGSIAGTIDRHRRDIEKVENQR